MTGLQFSSGNTAQPQEEHESRTRRKTGRYLSGAIDLQNSIYFNSQDNQFANERHGEIRYVLDANIIRFFLNPFRFEEYRKVAPFDRSARETLQALAAVTAEFILSRELPGQWGASPLISEPHAREVATRAHFIGEQARAVIEADNDDGLDPIVSDLIAGAKSKHRLRKTIDDAVTPLGGLGDWLNNEAFEAQEFARLINENLLRPLHLDPIGSPAVLKIPDDDLADVMDWMKLHRNESGYDDPLKLQNLKNDAETLIQLVKLNEEVVEHRKRHKTPREVRYVLVTADQTLYNAAIDWLRTEAKGRLDFFPVRRLGQYIPFLNMADTPNPIRSNQIFKDVRAAVAAFLSAVGGASGPPPRPLPAWDRKLAEHNNSPFHEMMSDLAGRMHRHATSDPNYLRRLNDLNLLWFQLSRETVFLNARLLGRRINAYTSLSVFLAEAKDVRNAVLKIISETVAAVERAHLKFSVHHNLAAMISELENSEDAVAPRRGMAVPMTRFKDLIDAPLFQFLTNLIRDPRSDRVVDLIDRVGSCAVHRAFFFSATVAFWASKWDSAHFFIERAVDTFPKGVDRSRPYEKPDLDYLTAVVKRYVVMDLDVNAAERLGRLCQLMEPTKNLIRQAEDSRDLFLICRAEMELAILLIHIAYCRHNVETEVDVEAANRDYREAMGYSVRSLEQIRDLRGKIESDVEQLLIVEVLVALSACLIYSVFYLEDTDKDYTEEFRPFVDEVNQLISEAEEYIPEIYKLVPDLLDIIYTASVGDKKIKISKVIEKMGQFKNRSANTTRMDNQGIVVFEKKLKAKTK